MLLRIALCASMVLLSSCVRHSEPLAPAPPKPVNPRAYVDLIPGCRLRVVAPLFAPGTQKRALAKLLSETGSSTTLKAPPGFVGYETAYYLLRPRSDHRGASIAFQYATTNKSGVVTRENRPRKRLFRVPREIRFFRLVFLIRKSNSDHNMALLGTHRKDALNAWSAALLADPDACRNLKGRSCMWIPAGIAVRPEIRKASRWEPLR
ncbi:MAG TPA: hypothetical protein VF283_14600 [Bryobacteraceae bacterium]